MRVGVLDKEKSTTRAALSLFLSLKHTHTHTFACTHTHKLRGAAKRAQQLKRSCCCAVHDKHTVDFACGSIPPVLSITHFWQDLTSTTEAFFWIQLQPSAPSHLSSSWIQRKKRLDVLTSTFTCLHPCMLTPLILTMPLA